MINNLPIRLDYYQYAIETWQKIFGEIDFSKINSIVDLCPGWAPKIEIALLRTNFSGRLIAIDKSKENTDCFNKLFAPFESKFKVTTLNIDLFKRMNKLTNLERSSDLVIANHIIDDLIMDIFFRKNNFFKKEEVFENPKRMKNIWDEILKHEEIFNEAKDKIKKIIDKTVNLDGYFLMTQYLGYQENLYGLKGVCIKCKSIAEEIKNDLIFKGNYKEERNKISKAFENFDNPYFQKNDIWMIRKN
jgi:hypothetical protein